MAGPEYDPDFEAYLRGRVRLDRRLPRSLTRLEPPAELDRIVIGMAREAIQPLPNAPLLRAPKWAVPLAMAASLLVSFTLMLDVGLRQGYREPVSEALLVELTNPTAPPAPAALVPAPVAAVAAAAGGPGPAVPESPRVFRLTRQRLAANRVSPSHQGVAAYAPAPAAGRPATADAAVARAATPAVASAPAVADATANAQVGHRAAPAASELEEARYSGSPAPAPIRLASAPPEMETVVVIGTRIQGAPFGTR